MSTVEVRSLDIPAPIIFENMTFPAYRHLLHNDRAPRHLEADDGRLIRPLALAAWHGDNAVGLVLAELPIARDGSAPQLLSMFVAPTLRDNGIGTAMLTALEEEVRRRGFDYMETVYTTGRPGTEAMERVLAKRQWSTPVTRAITVRFVPSAIVGMPWFEDVRLSAPECDIFPWSDLRPDERDTIRRTNDEAPWIPPGREPWRHDVDGFDAVASVGIRCQGAVVGWVIGRELIEQTTSFSCGFVREDLEARLLYPMFAESIRRMAEAGRQIGMFVTPVEESQLALLLRERCPETLDFFGETRGATKWLNETALGA